MSSLVHAASVWLETPNGPVTQRRLFKRQWISQDAGPSRAESKYGYTMNRIIHRPHTVGIFNSSSVIIPELFYPVELEV